MPNGCAVPMGVVLPVWYSRCCAVGEVQRQVQGALRCLDSVMGPGFGGGVAAGFPVIGGGAVLMDLHN